MTDEERYERRRAWLKRVLDENPNATWAKNELKFMTVDDFSKHPRKLLQDRGSVGVCDAAVAAEIRYNGTGGFYD